MRARFHLPGLTKNFSFNLIFAHMMKNCPYFFREGVEIASFYGVFPPSIWNGGRTQGGVCDKTFVKQVINIPTAIRSQTPVFVQMKVFTTSLYAASLSKNIIYLPNH